MKKNDSKKVGIFITVRTGSTRLPNKSLKKLGNQKLIEQIIDRAKLSKLTDLVVVCTSTRKEDDILEKIAKQKKVECFRGPLEDKLERWHQAAKKYNLDFFVTFDADDPFCDPHLVDLGIKQMLAKPCDLIQPPKNLIYGAFTFCVDAKALDKVCEIKDSKDTEMMWVYFTDTGLFKVTDLKLDDKIYLQQDKIRLTLDYPEDLKFFRLIFKNLKIKKNNLPLKEIIKYLLDNPKISQINFFRQNEFVANQKQKSKIKLKKGVV